jgi:hypothetical protein
VEMRTRAVHGAADAVGKAGQHRAAHGRVMHHRLAQLGLLGVCVQVKMWGRVGRVRRVGRVGMVGTVGRVVR